GCTLDGYPTVSYLDASGKPAATGSNAPVSGTDRGLVELQPGGAASFWAGYYDNGPAFDANGNLATCPTAAAVEITVPGTTIPLSVHQNTGQVLGQVCSVTDVQAIQAGPSPPADN
ncbi:MAG: DUF4232 domain-containing protein, partial [Gaiellaceae bacterium]